MSSVAYLKEVIGSFFSMCLLIIILFKDHNNKMVQLYHKIKKIQECLNSSWRMWDFELYKRSKTFKYWTL